MGTTTVPVPKRVWVYKDINGTFICWSGTDPDARVNYFSWVFITSETVCLSIHLSIRPPIRQLVDRLVDRLTSQLVNQSVGW